MSAAYGTPQFGGENFGGWGTLESYSMDPQAYLNQASSNGVYGMGAANSSQNSFWAMQKQWVGAQASLAKNQMMLFY